MSLSEVVDEQVLRRYRALLDAEDAAFDELEHACEEGDRARFEAELDAWGQAVQARLAYLRRLGLSTPPGAS